MCKREWSTDIKADSGGRQVGMSVLGDHEGARIKKGIVTPN